VAKVGKHIPSFGQQLAFGNATLQAGGLTALLVPNGISGQSTSFWLDIYGIDISSSDSTAQTVTLSDGVTTVTYYVASPSPIDSNCPVPVRFRQGAPLYASAGAGTSGRAISVVVRGVYAST
jgi:hypothetical protein